jgi:hypothetical protein
MVRVLQGELHQAGREACSQLGTPGRVAVQEEHLGLQAPVQERNRRIIAGPDASLGLLRLEVGQGVGRPDSVGL